MQSSQGESDKKFYTRRPLTYHQFQYTYNTIPPQPLSTTTYSTHYQLLPSAHSATRPSSRRQRTTGAIQNFKGTAHSYLDLQTPEYWYYYNYYYQRQRPVSTMASYPRDIPSYRHSAGYLMSPPTPPHLSSSPRSGMAISRSPTASDMYRTSTLPTMMPQPAIPESYVHKTFRDFADHAYRCPSCYDPLRVHLEGRQLCHKGHKLARRVSSALYEEANLKYRLSSKNKRRSDGWQPIEVAIPEGCEVVRSLLVAIERGLQLHSSSHNEIVPSTPVTPSTPHRRSGHFDDSLYAYYQKQISTPASDEELYSHHNSRGREREVTEHHRSHSHRRSSSTGARRKTPFIGVVERERRPYAGSHSSNNSVDSGYSSAGSPDHLRRGSQFEQDMKRRRDRPKSILKKSLSFEREHTLSGSPPKHPDSPRSPTKGTNQEKYVFFNISGECLAPGFD